MIKPTIHMNGTSARDLALRFEEAATAIFRAREALMLAGPNARDYYPQGDQAYQQARREHDVRAKALMDAEHDMQALAEYVQEQDELKNRTR